MKTVQIRNAAILLRIADRRLLGDPCSPPGSLVEGARPKPLVPLPEIAGASRSAGIAE